MRGWSTKEHTSAPLASYIEVAARVIPDEDVTEVASALVPGLQEQLIGLHFTLGEELEAEDTPGAPSAALLLDAVAALTAWLPLTQERLARYVGISPSTVMAWRRLPDVHPRHPHIPTLLRLWAAVSGARQEFGEAETSRLVWGSGSGSPALPALPSEELAEHLLAAAEEASLDAFNDDGYTPGGATLMSVEEIEAGERGLSHEPSHDLEGLGETGPA